MSVDILLRPSRYLMIYLLMVYALALLSLMVLNVFWWWKALLAILVSGYFVYAWHHYVMVSSTEHPSRIIYTDTQWQMVLRNRTIAMDLKHATVWRHLVTLHFRQSDTHQSYQVIILPDSCDAEQFRQLRVLLRFGLQPFPKRLTHQ